MTVESTAYELGEANQQAQREELAWQFRNACRALRATSATVARSISVTTQLYDTPYDGADIFALGKRIAREYNLRATASLKDRVLTVRFVHHQD